jgi:hypothetical protein
MPSRCRFCHAEGHNIRTCEDPRIIDELNDLMVEWVAEDLVLDTLTRITEEMHYRMRRYILSHLSVEMIRAISIQYGGAGTGTHLSIHIANIIELIFDEVERVIHFTPEQKEEWCWMRTGMSMNEYLAIVEASFDMDFDYNQETAGDIKEDKYPVYDIILKPLSGELDTTLECAVCQEETLAGRFDKTQCGHSFCHDCISTHLTLKRFDRAKCPLCRADIISLEATDQSCYDSLYCNFSEMGALMKDCEKLWELE